MRRRLGVLATLLALSAATTARADPAFEAALRALNGDVFWAPASATDDVVNRFGDEARAVFGPIPPGDCNGPDSREIPVEVNGNRVELRQRADGTFAFAHLGLAGDVVRWTAGVPRCDKPSLAGEIAYCGPASRVARVTRGNVDWMFLCRKTLPSRSVEDDPYWLPSNPAFGLYGFFGYNRVTGEMAFFDGRKDRESFDWSRPFGPPGGRGYGDADGRARAAELFDPTFAVQCSSCHDNKNAYVVTPPTSVGRLGYFAGPSSPRAKAFGLADFVPETPRLEGAPLRVVGTGYTTRYAKTLARARTVRDPTGQCTACHTLTTQLTGQRFAADAVARPPHVDRPTWAQTLELRRETERYLIVAGRRTDWALRSGDGKIHPWMTPGAGNRHAAMAEPMKENDWHALSTCLWGAGGEECGYRPLYTPCPVPGTGEGGDGFGPTGTTAIVRPTVGGSSAVLRVAWRYLNGYGGVPERDDVRFDVSLRPLGSSIDGAGADDRASLGVGEPPRTIRDASFLGHRRFTEPGPAEGPRPYRVDVPIRCGQRYAVTVTPKRYCFDPSGVVHGMAEPPIVVDVPCSGPRGD